MTGITGWAQDLLLSRGALVDREPDGPLRALLPPETAAALGTGEWLSLNFSADAGADDPFEWLERLGQLLPADRRIAGARLRRGISGQPLDAVQILDRKLVIQNGVHRLVEDSPRTAIYLCFLFEYVLESDDRNIGTTAICLNATAGSLVPQARGATAVRARRPGAETGFCHPRS